MKSKLLDFPVDSHLFLGYIGLFQVLHSFSDSHARQYALEKGISIFFFDYSDRLSSSLLMG